jgi:two-component system OmpR family response regulator
MYSCDNIPHILDASVLDWEAHPTRLVMTSPEPPVSPGPTGRPADPTAGGGRRLRILCVDDAPDTADTLRLLAELHGYEAAACYDGPSAITIAEQFQPDVCLLDLNMPGMDGIALARWLAYQAGGRPVGLVAVTAMAGDEFQCRTAAAGFRRHLVKPVEPDRLLAEMAAAWEEARRDHTLATTPLAGSGGTPVPVDR